MSVVVVGSIAIDPVKTPVEGHSELLGGSPSYDCSGGARAEATSTRAVDGGQGAAFDIFKNLERPKRVNNKTQVVREKRHVRHLVRHSSCVIPSSFVIRPLSF